MKITVKEMILIYQTLLKLSEVKTDIWYAVSKNKAKCKRPFEEYIEVERACVDKLAAKDDGGNLIIDPATGNFTFNTENERFEFDKLLSDSQGEEIEIDFYTVKITDSFKNESHPANLIEPLIDKILIE